MIKIPLTKPYFTEEEMKAVFKVLNSGWVTQGEKVEEFEKKFAQYSGAKYAVALNSATSGLHLSLLALGIGEGDEVILPPFTHIATANSIEYVGAKPIFADIDSKTYNINPSYIEKKITKRTKAIIPVHLFGLCADMKPIMRLAKKHHLYIIEDAACALGSRYFGKFAGTFGELGVFSLHPRKIITTGEGGMAVTNNRKLYEKLKVLRSHGATVSDLERHKKGILAQERFNILGYNYRLTDIQAAIGIEQMKKLPWIIKQRRERAHYYDRSLTNLEFIKIPYVPKTYFHTYQSYVVLIKDNSPLSRDKIRKRLEKEGISTRIGTYAIHHQGYYKRKYEIKPDDFPISLRAEKRTITLPLYPQMSKKEQDYVIERLKKCVE